MVADTVETERVVAHCDPDQMPSTYLMWPKEDRCILRRDEVAERTKGGLWIPDVARDRQQEVVTFGTIVATGPDVRDVKVGDYVVFGQYAGANVKIMEGNEVMSFVVLREGDIYITLEGRDAGKASSVQGSQT